jgi:hypothetical protein
MTNTKYLFVRQLVIIGSYYFVSQQSLAVTA